LGFFVELIRVEQMNGLAAHQTCHPLLSMHPETLPQMSCAVVLTDSAEVEQPSSPMCGMMVLFSDLDPET
jgi:hypothetical protein